MPKHYSSLQEIVDQLESCVYETSDQYHDLENNTAFIALKKRAAAEQVEDTLQTILSKLKRIKEAKPTIDYSTYWREVESATNAENDAFVKENEKLTIKDDMLHRCFSGCGCDTRSCQFWDCGVCSIQAKVCHLRTVGELDE